MNFDLTTKQGIKKACSWTGSSGTALAAYSSLASGIVLPPFMGFSILDLLKKLFSSDEANEKQAQAAKDLIQAGKENGVKKMKIKVDNEVGVKVKANTPADLADVEGHAGSNGTMELEVEYK